MRDRVSALMTTAEWRVAATRHEEADGTVYHMLPGVHLHRADVTPEDALRHVLRERLGIDVVVGRLVEVVRTGPYDEYVFLARPATGDLRLPDHGRDVPGSFRWAEIDYDKAAVRAAGLRPRHLAHFLAGHMHHGHDLNTLPDVRSRPAPVRRHGRRRG